MKIMKYLKSFICILLIVVIQVNSFASVVADVDGSTFVTKGEYENLKDLFSEQINNYNNSITSKIEGAIASYLNGITFSTVEISLLNSISKTQKFVNAWSLPSPTYGTNNYDYYINIGIYAINPSVSSTLVQVQLLTGTINNPAWKLHSSTATPARYLYGQRLDTSVAGVYDYIISDTLSSYSVSSVAGSKSEASVNSYTSNSYNSTPIKSTYEKTATETTQGTYTSVFEVDFGGSVKDIPVNKSFAFKDEFSKFDTTLIPGTALSTTNYYFIDDAEINDLGDLQATKHADYWGREIQNKGLGWSQNTVEWASATNLGIYSHKYTTMQLTRILNELATNVYNENVYYYQGIPVCRCTKDGDELTIKFKFVNDGNGATNFVVQKGPFSNTSISTSYGSTVELGETLRANNNQIIEFKIKNVKKNDTFWIKALPITSNTKTTIETTEITIK